MNDISEFFLTFSCPRLPGVTFPHKKCLETQPNTLGSLQAGTYFNHNSAWLLPAEISILVTRHTE